MQFFNPVQKTGTENVTLTIAEGVDIVYHANLYDEDFRIDGLTITAKTFQFISRRSSVDTWLIIPDDNFCAEHPRTFHAMMVAGAALLFQHNGRNRGYEDERDRVIDVRSILQSVATRYSVDVNEMSEMWPRARLWLGHSQYPAPLTITELAGNLVRQGKAEIRQ